MVMSSPIKELKITNVVIWGGRYRGVQIRVVVCIWVSVVVIPSVSVLILIPIILWVRRNRPNW